MAPRRRTVLTAVSTATASALAGCADLLGEETDDEDESSADEAKDAATAFVADLANERFGDARDRFVPAMRDDFAALGQLEQTWMGYTAIGGEFKEIVETTVTDQDGSYTARVSLAFERGTHDLLVAMDDEYRYGEYRPGDEYERPAYVDPAAVTEQDVTLETAADDCSLSGILTMPADAEDDVPGVVLVHDAGRISMDSETIATKLFKDLAEGLATQGIATLRYNKRTLECEQSTDEYGLDAVAVDDALTAIDELRSTDDIDDNRIVVAGHGLGGLAGPRVAARDGELAGVIGLAAPARPFHEIVLEKARHQATIGDYEWESRTARYEAWADEVDRIPAGDYGPDELVLGYYGSLWDSLAAYDHVAVARELDVPTYFLQGERDTRVTVEDDLERWRDELETSVEVYDGLNRAFMPGEGPAIPSEYDLRNNADERVVDDIADWIDDL